MYLAGRGRNETARLLQQEGIHVSEGSTGNIIREYRRRYQQENGNSDIKSSEAEAQTQRPHPTQQVNQVNTSTNTTYTEDNIINSTGNLLSNISTPSPLGRPEPAKPVSKNKNSGNPLSFFDKVVYSTTVGPDATIVPESYSHANESFFRFWL
jgi:hypothetical protein